MARNELPDQEVERRLREHFEEEARDLRAPDDLWARLQGRLGKQQPPRFGFLRGGAPAIGGRPWVPAAAAAVVVVAVGMGVWALAGGAGDSGGDDYDAVAPVAAATRGRAEATQAAATEAAATAYPTQGAATQAAAAAQESAARESGAEATQVAATEAAREQAAAATPAPTEAAPVQAAATEAAATEAAEATPAPAPEQVAVATPAATPAAESAPPAAEAAPVPPDDSDAAGDSAAPEAMGDGAPPEEADSADGDESMADDMDYADAGDEDMADASYDEEEAEEEADDSVGAPPATANPGGPPAQRSEPEPPPPQQRSGTTFEDYGRIAFVDTSTDAVSTFSLDTDRTSYFLALAWVSDGYTVDPDSVRAEEWINAFDYTYAGPADDSSFAITSDLVRHPLDRDWHIARIALQAPDVRDDTPLNVTLVLDASGSMDWGNRVAIARAAAEAIRQSLSDRDRIAVVHFTTDVIDAYTVEHSSPDDDDVECCPSAGWRRTTARTCRPGSTWACNWPTRPAASAPTPSTTSS